MRQLDKIFQHAQTYVIQALVLLIPIFFLPVTRDFVIISKFFFILYGVIGLFILSFFHLAFIKKVKFFSNPFVHALLLVIVSYVLSILLMSPNKIQALYNPHSGFLIVLSLIALFYMATNGTSNKKSESRLSLALIISGFVVSLMSLLFIIQPFKNAQLPANLLFLKNSFFNTVGSQIELVIFLVFILILGVNELMKMRKVTVVNDDDEKKDTGYILFIILTVVIALGIGMQVYQIVRSITVLGSKIVLPPLGVSWYAAVEVLKNPLTALFGVGVDNFASIFTQSKSAAYNYSDNWQIASFPASRSAVLQILTELGLLGLAAFSILFARIFKHFKNVKRLTMILMAYAIAMLFLFPPSLITYFMFFVALIIFTHDLQARDTQQEGYEIDFSNILPLHIAALAITGLMIAGLTYHVTRTFAGEVFYKKAIDAVAANNLQDLYNNQRQAVILYPQNEDFRINFSQTHLIIANNLASKKPEDITDNDRQQISQAIQAAIAEGKAAASLNPNKVANWQYLASLYRNIINVAEGAEEWTVASYQQAIRLDPQNPVHRVDLGGVFYLYKNYDSAQQLFEQAVTLKNDWSNAWYNLAWTLAQKKDYAGAVTAMQNVVSLIDPKTQDADYKKAMNELDEFKKLVPTPTPTPEGQQQVQQQQNLVLPSPPAATVEPKLDVGEESSPPATTQ